MPKRVKKPRCLWCRRKPARPLFDDCDRLAYCSLECAATAALSDPNPYWVWNAEFSHWSLTYPSL